MKKLCLFIVCALLLMCGASAWADEVVLPHPGYYFGRNFNGFAIYFDEYPKAEYDAYVSLLMEQYDMKIIDEQILPSSEFVFLAKPGVKDYQVFVTCYKKYYLGEYEYGLEYSFSKDVTLSAMETYSPAAEEEGIATNDGLTVLSPEQYLGIEPCDNLSTNDNEYAYVYTNRGYKYHSSGTSNPVDWYRMEEYVNALVDSGYYEILEHSSDTDDAYWTLRYIGPAEVSNTFYLYYGRSDQAAIAVRNFIGDIKVWYSKDILTADIDETQQRLGRQVITTPADTSSSASHSVSSGSICTECRGDGKCNECGGDMWVWKWETEYVNGSPVTKQVNKMCQAVYCTGGKCSKCGGDGIQ